jgi:hypothetical protein
MPGGPVDELVDVTVEGLALDQLEVEVGCTLEDGVTARDGRVRPVVGSCSVVDTTVAGTFSIGVTHGSRTSDSSVLEACMPANARYVSASKTIRCSASYKARRWASSSGPV